MINKDIYVRINKEVRRILRFDWNPIGHSGLPEDEYDSYALQIVSVICNGGTKDDISESLYMSLKNMGLDALRNDKEYLNNEEMVIQKLLALQEII